MQKSYSLHFLAIHVFSTRGLPGIDSFAKLWSGIFIMGGDVKDCYT